MTSILKVDELQDSSGNLIIKEVANAITIGASGDTIAVGTGATNNLGITQADQWRLTADQSGGTNGDITSNLERVDTDGFGHIGTGMSESSGIFTFPSTGFYLITAQVRILADSGDTEANVDIQTETGSGYGTAATAVAGNEGGGADVELNGTTSFIFDVTSTSTHKVKFVTASMGNSALLGNTDSNQTVFTFLRLGDT
jgi:hypothetical protein